MFVDQGSLVDIMYWKTYQKLQIPEEAMTLHDEPIYGFSRERVCTRRYIDLHKVYHEGNQTKNIHVRFLVVEAHTSYIVLLGRPSLNTLGAVVSTFHLAMKFPFVVNYILTIHKDQNLV